MIDKAKRSSTDCDLALRTRQRLLEVAGEVFAEQGYRAATIREICKRAGANVAAVNYHFRDKDGLYAECLTYWMNEALKRYPRDMGVTATSSPAERLHAFVRSFLFRILDESRHSCYGKLIARNLVENTPFVEICVEQSFRPSSDLLETIIREIVGPKVSQEQVRLAGISIFGQITFHRHARFAVGKVYPEITYTDADLERLARQITDFSLAGLRALPRAIEHDVNSENEQGAL